MQEVKTVEEFENLVSSDDVTFVYFTAVWCGPCQKVGPVFRGLQGVRLVKVDADAAEPVFDAQNIQAIPTVQVWRAKTLLKTINGCSGDAVAALHKQYS